MHRAVALTLRRERKHYSNNVNLCVLLHKEKEIFSRRWCELLFEGRNKEYGAYRLRSELGWRYKMVVVVLACLFVVMLALGLIYIKVFGGGRPARPAVVEQIVHFEGIMLQEVEPKKKEASQLEEQSDLRLENGREGDESGEEEGGGGEQLAENGEDESVVDSLDAEDADSLWLLAQTEGLRVDSIAQYPGGIRKLMEWLETRVVYPEGSLKARREGKVRVAFIVESDGRIGATWIVESADTLMSREVLRVMKEMPAWGPALRDGRAVRSRVTLPIEFVIQN